MAFGKVQKQKSLDRKDKEGLSKNSRICIFKLSFIFIMIQETKVVIVSFMLFYYKIEINIWMYQQINKVNKK